MPPRAVSPAIASRIAALNGPKSGDNSPSLRRAPAPKRSVSPRRSMSVKERVSSFNQRNNSEAVAPSKPTPMRVLPNALSTEDSTSTLPVPVPLPSKQLSACHSNSSAVSSTRKGKSFHAVSLRAAAELNPGTHSERRKLKVLSTTTHYPLHYSQRTTTTHYSLLAIYNSLLATRYSLLATRYSPLATRYSLLATRYSLLAPRSSLLATRYSLLTTWHLRLAISEVNVGSTGYSKAVKHSAARKIHTTELLCGHEQWPSATCFAMDFCC